MSDQPISGSRPPVIIGNCSGFYGDRISAMAEMLKEANSTTSPVTISPN